jgi:hypothetical protein
MGFKQKVPGKVHVKPTASPEFMVLEECRNISKNDLLVLPFVLTFSISIMIKWGDLFHLYNRRTSIHLHPVHLRTFRDNPVLAQRHTDS